MTFGNALAFDLVGALIGYGAFCCSAAYMLAKHLDKKRVLMGAILYAPISALLASWLYTSGAFHITARPLGELVLVYYTVIALTGVFYYIFHVSWRTSFITAALIYFLAVSASSVAHRLVLRPLYVSASVQDYVLYTMITYLGEPLMLFFMLLILHRFDVRNVYSYWLHNERLKKITNITAIFIPSIQTMIVWLDTAHTDIPHVNPLLTLLTVVLFFMAFFYVSKDAEQARRLAQQEAALRQQELYVTNLEKVQTDMRAFRHDFKNMLAGIYIQAQEGDLAAVQTFISGVTTHFDQQVGAQIYQTTQIGNIHIPEIKSLLLEKLMEMHRKNIRCELEVACALESVAMNSTDLCRALGILIDNAIEARKAYGNQPDYCVSVAINPRQNGASFVVKNPVPEDFDFAKTIQPGYTTKGRRRHGTGEDHGIGLASYRKIIDSYDNILTRCAVEDGCFYQEFIILEGTPHASGIYM